jgi:hypothetical protein
MNSSWNCYRRTGFLGRPKLTEKWAAKIEDGMRVAVDFIAEIAE